MDAGYGDYPDWNWLSRSGHLWSNDAEFGTYPNLVVNNKMPVRGRDKINEIFRHINQFYPHAHFVRHLATNAGISFMMGRRVQGLPRRPGGLKAREQAFQTSALSRRRDIKRQGPLHRSRLRRAFVPPLSSTYCSHSRSMESSGVEIGTERGGGQFLKFHRHAIQ